MFLLNKKSKIRKACMKLAEPPENLAILQEIEKAGSYEMYLKEQEDKACQERE